MVRLLLGALVIAVALVQAAVATGATQAKVTVIGDSVADAMEHSPVALDSMNQGFSIHLQTRGCRRLRAPSCVIAGSSGPAPTTLQVVRKLGPYLGKIVVVDVGYNDTPQHYSRDMDTVMQALDKAGVRTVVWLTLRDPDGVYALSNAKIDSGPKEWPQLVVADWDHHADGHPLWFQPDGIHLTKLGAANLGEFIHQALVRHAPS
jgi:hypothetical protein